MPPKKRRRHVINLERGADGSWHEAPRPGEIRGAFVNDPDLQKSSPYPTRSKAELHALRGLLGLESPPLGVDVRPSLLDKYATYSHPPVPGSIGRWLGRGTKKDPYHWVGVSERVAAYGLAVLLAVWGLEQIDVDISNWWSASVVNAENDLTGLSQDVLNLLHIPYTLDGNGNVAAVGTRQTNTFVSWLAQQVMIQGGDLQTLTTGVGSLATGFPAGQGTNTGPPVIQGPPGSSPTPLPVAYPVLVATANPGNTPIKTGAYFNLRVAISGGNPPYLVRWLGPSGVVAQPLTGTSATANAVWHAGAPGTYGLMLTVSDSPASGYAGQTAQALQQLLVTP